MARGYEDRQTFFRVFEAAGLNNVAILKDILEKERLPLTITNRQGHTLAHIAVKNDNVEVLKYVLTKQPSLLEQKDMYRCTILHQAVVKGSLKSVKYLVEEHGVDICYLGGKYEDRSAVHVAVEFNHLAILKYFIEDRKVDFNVPNLEQKTPPFFLTVKNRNWDVIKYLVEEKNVDVHALNYKQENILFPIVRENFMSFMTYLLDEKKFDFDVNWRSLSGETLVHLAAGHGRLNIMEYLVDKKYALVDVRKATDDKTPLHYAALQDDFDICEFLIDRGANPSIEDRFGDRPADKARKGSLIDYLVEKAVTTRRPRSAPTFHSSREVVAPFKVSTPRRDIGHAGRPVGHSEDVKFSLGYAGSNLTFQNFLFLAPAIMRAVRKAPDQQNAQSFQSPTSIVRSKMSSVAIDAIEEGVDFSKF